MVDTSTPWTGNPDYFPRGHILDNYPHGNTPLIGSPAATTTPPAQVAYIGQGGDSLQQWYMIIIALVILYIIMQHFPKWGIPFGFLVVLGAILLCTSCQDSLKTLLHFIQYGSLQ